MLPWPWSARSSRSRKYVVHVAAADQPRGVPARARRHHLEGGPDQLLAQPPRLVTRDGAQLAAQGLVHPLQLAQRGPYVAAVGVLPGQREVGLLVGRVRAEQVLPPAGQPEQVLVQGGQRVAALGRPRLVGVVGQQGTGVHRECLLRLLGRAVGQGRLGGAAELDRVDAHLVVGEQQDLVLPQQQRARPVAECTPRVVRRLVQARAGHVDRDTGPQRVHHPFAVHPAAVRQREQLHQGGGAASAPGLVRHRLSVGRDSEASEQRDVDEHVGASIGIGPHGYGKANAGPRGRPVNAPPRAATRGTRPRRSWRR